jgi:hypothetical protein
MANRLNKIRINQVQLENWSFSLSKTPPLDLDKVYLSN